MPVKNEAWFLANALAAASTWADRIIVADQGSQDGSAEIAQRFSKVTLIHNRSETYSEAARQSLLLSEARKIPGRRIIFAIDADEVLSSTWDSSPEWEEILAAPPGTIIRFPKAELLPDGRSYWVASGGDPVHGLVDDGTPVRGEVIHAPRLPMPEPHRWIRPENLWLLHYRALDPARLSAKMRWYQCWERLEHPRKRPIAIFRQYHRDSEPHRTFPRADSWTDGYKRLGIDVDDFPKGGHYSWDDAVAAMFVEHGVETFRRLDVFGPWQQVVAANHPDARRVATDPRSRHERRVHAWLRRTQPYAGSRSVRLIQRALRALGW